VKIVDFEIIRLLGPEFTTAVRPAWAPGSTWSRRDATLVKLTTEDGLVGWGVPGYTATPALENWVKPHHGRGGLGLAAHLHLACAIPNSTYFEMLHEPPGMSSDDFQWYMREPLRVDAQGDIVAPWAPGLGVEPDPDKLAHYRVG
jgi:L-alanine-DL-glutamate epimerase-like enolase superfamily enzyme